MNYHDITKCDMKNGPGLRTVLWVAGCNHHCKGCQNPVTWDPSGGLLFDRAVLKELMDSLREDWCAGLTLSGGDPLYPENRRDIAWIVQKVVSNWGLHSRNQTIWLYTGYKFENLMEERKTDLWLDYILDEIDVLVDGEYIEEQRDTSRFWVGSDNQRIWKHDIIFDDWEEMEKEHVRSLSDEQHEKEKGCDC